MYMLDSDIDHNEGGKQAVRGGRRHEGNTEHLVDRGKSHRT